MGDDCLVSSSQQLLQVLKGPDTGWGSLELTFDVVVGVTVSECDWYSGRTMRST